MGKRILKDPQLLLKLETTALTIRYRDMLCDCHLSVGWFFRDVAYCGRQQCTGPVHWRWKKDPGSQSLMLWERESISVEQFHVYRAAALFTAGGALKACSEGSRSAGKGASNMNISSVCAVIVMCLIVDLLKSMAFFHWLQRILNQAP